MSYSPLTHRSTQGRQSGDAGWSVTSRYGSVPVKQLRMVSGAGAARSSARFDPTLQPAPMSAPMPKPASIAPPPQVGSDGGPDLRSDQGFSMPVRPGAPCAAGILTKRACAAKTSEPLSRL